MMKEIDVFIPVYKESKVLEPLIRELVTDNYINKKLFVIIDKPTRKSVEVSKKFSRDVKFILNKKRLGKANVLNEHVGKTSGDILLFLDSDVLINNSKGDFLSGIVKEMKNTDMLDIKKTVVRDSFLSKMTYYEYLAFNINSWLISKSIGKCPAVNGSAFAVKRKMFESLGGFGKVMFEDLDFATRAFINDYKFKYTDKVEVHNIVFSSWKKWFKQRNRWSVGVILWFKKYYRELIQAVKKYPRIFIPGLLSLLPSSFLFITYIAIPDIFMYKFFVFFILLLSVKATFLLPFLVFVTTGVGIFKSMFAMLSSFAVFSVIFHYFSRKIGFQFKYHEFFVYYFFYSFLNLLVLISTIIKIFVFQKKVKLDWKV